MKNKIKMTYTGMKLKEKPTTVGEFATRIISHHKKIKNQNPQPIEEKETIQLVKRYRVNSEIRIDKCKVYVSVDDEKEYARLTGKFYIFNNSIVNGIIKISKRPADKSKVVGWVDLKNVEVVKK